MELDFNVWTCCCNTTGMAKCSHLEVLQSQATKKNWFLVPLCCFGPFQRWFLWCFNWISCVAILTSCVFTLNKVATFLCSLPFLFCSPFWFFGDSVPRSNQLCVFHVYALMATVPYFNLCLYDVIWSTAVFSCTQHAFLLHTSGCVFKVPRHLCSSGNVKCSSSFTRRRTKWQPLNVREIWQQTTKVISR